MAAGDYVKTIWLTGDIITATKLNNNENKTDELDKNAVYKDGTVAMTGKFNANAGLGFQGGDFAVGSISTDANWGAFIKGRSGVAADVALVSADGLDLVKLKSGGVFTHKDNAIWTAGNDGTSSGLDADLLDGLNSGNATGNIPISNGTLNTNLNADRVDSLHFRVVSGVLEFDDGGGFKPVGGIKNVQRGIVFAADTGTTNVTISSVTLSKTKVSISTVTIGAENVSAKQTITAQLTTATNIAFVGNGSGASTTPIAWEVVE